MDLLAYSCVLCTLKKMSRCDGVDPVMLVIADRHGEAEAVLHCNFLISCFLSKHFARLVGAGLALSLSKLAFADNQMATIKLVP